MLSAFIYSKLLCRCASTSVTCAEGINPAMFVIKSSQVQTKKSKSSNKRIIKVKQQDLSMKQRKNSKYKVKDQQCYFLKGQSLSSNQKKIQVESRRKPAYVCKPLNYYIPMNLKYYKWDSLAFQVKIYFTLVNTYTYMVVEKLLQMIDELRLFTFSPNDKLSPIH